MQQLIPPSLSLGQAGSCRESRSGTPRRESAGGGLGRRRRRSHSIELSSQRGVRLEEYDARLARVLCAGRTKSLVDRSAVRDQVVKPCCL